jgi:hypothetical protein
MRRDELLILDSLLGFLLEYEDHFLIVIMGSCDYDSDFRDNFWKKCEWMITSQLLSIQK